MGKGARFGAGALLVAALLVGAAWWLLAGHGEDAASGDARGAASASAPKLPESAPVLPAPSAALPTAALVPDAAQAAAPTAATTPLTDFTGRVVDESGRAIAGAVVYHWPSIEVRVERKFGAGFPAPVDRTRLGQARTDAEGRFTLPIDDRPPGPDALQRITGPYVSDKTFDALVPALIVAHADFEITMFPCRGWKGGPFAAGDLVVKDGAHVVGRAVDEAHEPLAGVSVAPPPFQMDDDRSRQGEWDTVSKLLGMVTDDDGRFAIDSLWAGTEPLTFNAAGREPLMLKPLAQAGAIVDVGDVVLGRGLAIDGFVLDPQGGPIAGARVLARLDGIAPKPDGDGGAAWELASRVTINGFVSDVEVKTDETGAFHLAGLPTPNWISHGSEPEKPLYRVLAGADGREATLMAPVAAGGEPITLTLRPAGRVVLTVVEADSHAPMPDVTIKAQRMVPAYDDEQPLSIEAVTDPAALQAAGLAPPFAGVFLLQPAGNRRNEVVISAPGHATQGFVLPNVAPGESKSQTVELPRASRLAGRILDADKHPIAGAQVGLVLPKTLRVQLPSRSTETDADGRFAFDLLQRGDWAVHAGATGFVDGETPPITVKKATAVEDVELVLQRAGAVAGVVLEGGVPKAGQVVRIEPVPPPGTAPAPTGGPVAATPKASSAKAALLAAKDSARRAAQTDTDGRFRIDSLAPGAYLLSGPPGVKQPVDVAAAQTSEVTLVARALPRVRGRVTDAHGPVAGAEISADMELPPPLGGWMRADGTAISDANGQFELVEADPGHYHVNAKQGESGTPVVDANLDWDTAPWVELRFAGGEVHGTIVEDGSGQPVAGAQVQLTLAAPPGSTGKGSAWHQSAKSGEGGRFDFTRVPGGALKLTVNHPDFIVVPLLPVQVPEDRAAPDMQVALQRGGVVKGTVTAGGPLGESLYVRCVPLAAQGAETRVSVAASGSFERRQLAPGPWRCELYRRDGKTDGPVLATQPAEVKAGETASVELKMPG